MLCCRVSLILTFFSILTFVTFSSVLESLGFNLGEKSIPIRILIPIPPIYNVIIFTVLFLPRTQHGVTLLAVIYPD